MFVCVPIYIYIYICASICACHLFLIISPSSWLLKLGDYSVVNSGLKVEMVLYRESPLPNTALLHTFSRTCFFVVSCEGLPLLVQTIFPDKICYYILLCALFCPLSLLRSAVFFLSC